MVCANAPMQDESRDAQRPFDDLCLEELIYLFLRIMRNVVHIVVSFTFISRFPSLLPV